MLGRLIQTAATYGRGGSTLESATEESHTRNLLYGQSHHIYPWTQSPPNSPHATPIFRPGSFDDRGGLELEEKDVRILIAQDAFGAEEKPTLLFDSRPASPTRATVPGHVRHASMTGPRSPLPNDWKPPGQHATSTPLDGPFKPRISAAGAAPWTKPTRDMGTREEAFLECMFGVTSSTKAPSTTKMHILPGRPRTSSKSDIRNKNLNDASDQPPKRAPLHRSRTSTSGVKPSFHPSASGLDADIQLQDSVLVTRLFSVGISEPVAPTLRASEIPLPPSAESIADGPVTPLSPAQRVQSPKKPKLVERKVPAFAIGLVISLPRASDSHFTPAQVGPTSRSAHAHTLSSASSSYGSDMQNSWTFLNAIPESLASTCSSVEESDRRIETIVGNEDVILRAIALLEIESTRCIHQQLQKILNRIVSPGPKVPKEKAMQRTNQQVISITDPASIANSRPLQDAVRQTTRRIVYAIRIPRVLTGLGFGAGHWSDEARAAFRACGRRQQNFFLYTLLTTFLGHHTQWLQRLAPEWYRRQHRLSARQHSDQHALCQRTVIVSDQRAMARRLIFLLASFLPGTQGLDGLQKPSEDLSGSNLSMSSPLSHVVRNESLRRAANRRMRENRLHSSSHERAMLSTSADSGDSIATAEQGRRFLVRQDSSNLSLRGPSLLSISDGEKSRKVSSSTTSALVSHPTTPVAVFSTKRGADPESYFPPFADDGESIATVGLTNILRRNSSSLGGSSNMSSRWGSLVSGLSEMWIHKQHASGGIENRAANPSAANGTEQRSSTSNPTGSKSNALQEMVDQLDESRRTHDRSPEIRFVEHNMGSPGESASPVRQMASMPRLRVDDKDGVVDVDLDLPGFTGFDVESIFKSPSKNINRSSSNGRDMADSVRSLRSIPASVSISTASADGNVAGYLKRHHEDFSLYAVRPYSELEEDIKRSMLAESLSISNHDDLRNPADGVWVPICSTVIADMRTFSVRKLTLKRKLDQGTALPSNNDSSNPNNSPAAKKHNGHVLEQQFSEEEVKDFDTVLADAIEKVLDIGDIVQGPAVSSPRMGHQRAPSSSTVRSTPPAGSNLGASSYTGVSQDYVRQDCRQLVLGALEEIAKDVCDDLNKLEKGRDIRSNRSADMPVVNEGAKQDNFLREGVKHWLLNLEQSKVF